MGMGEKNCDGILMFFLGDLMTVARNTSYTNGDLTGKNGDLMAMNGD